MDAPDEIVVCLHGFGSSAHEFRRHWACASQERNFLFLEGPEHDVFTGGRRWFSFTARADALVVSVGHAADQVEEQMARFEHVTLVGHSQGAMICLELVRRGKISVRSAWCYAGALPDGLHSFPQSRRGASVLHIFWSLADPFVDPLEVERTADFFSQISGVQVHRHASASLPHAFSPEWLDAAQFA